MNIARMMSNMERFVAVYHAAMESAPHIYLSALAWLPEGTLAYETLSKGFAHLPIVANKEPIWESARVTKKLDTDLSSVAYAPSGHYYAVGGDEEIHVWDARTNRLALYLVRPSCYGHSFVFSPDGCWLAFDSHGSICIWTLAIGKIRKILKTRFDSGRRSPDVTSLVFSLDGTRIASAYETGCILIWEVESENLIFNEDTGDEDDCIYSIAFSSDGKHIFSGSTSLHVWDVDTGAHTCIYTSPSGDLSRVSNLSCFRDGKLIVAAVEHVIGTDTVKLWNAQTYEAIWGLEDVGDTACLSFTEDSKEIYHCSRRGSIRVWSVETLELIKRMDLETEIHDASFSPDFQSILTGMDDSVSIFNIQFRVTKEISLGAVHGVTISPEGHYIASCHIKSQCINIWDAATGNMAMGPLQGHSNDVICVAFSDDGRWLVSGSDDHSVRIWNVLTDWTCGEALLGHTAPVISVVISSDSRLIASCSWDGTARIWEISTKLLVRTLEDTKLVSFFPGSRSLATASWNEGGCIYDVSSGYLITRFSEDKIYSLAVSPNSQWVACPRSGGVYLWDTKNYMKRNLAEYNDIVALKFTSDSLKLFFGERSGRVRCCDVESGTFLDARCFGVNYVEKAFSPDCKHILIYYRDSAFISNKFWGFRIIELALLDKIKDNDSSERIRRIRWDNACSGLDCDDGWLKDDEGRLLMWVPDRHRRDIKFRQKLVVASRSKQYTRAIRPTVDYERLMDYLEEGWTNIYRPNV